ncbi:hypothetical protein Afil01_24920 [Actinorhabdospora filicis]|uniref:Uncharacterized protein n=1 Tax=Actinorhabdospora filicis TaxID=1785913 RepID=A0A9W6SKQ0_9ACTN|nr:hypothetical protein [Actinorhabdospora filicis]GLZ77685.1 hypothetical protein Afil01_24920 [Actinorhabdospora filicis]
MDDRELLTALTRHVQYRDTYLGDDARPEVTVHGPYELARVTADAFEPVGHRDAAALIWAWARELGPLPETLVAALDRELMGPLGGAGAVYHLRNLGRDDWHDFGGIHTRFHELVLIDHANGRLTLVVAADD